MTILALIVGVVVGSLLLSLFDLIFLDSRCGITNKNSDRQVKKRRRAVTIVNLLIFAISLYFLIHLFGSDPDRDAINRFLGEDYRRNVSLYVFIISFLIAFNRHKLTNIITDLNDFIISLNTSVEIRDDDGGISRVQKNSITNAFSGLPWKLFFIISLGGIFLVPLFPGIEKSIRKLKFASAEVDLAEVASGATISLAQLRESPNLFANKFIHQWKLGSAFFSTREFAYEISHPDVMNGGPKSPKIQRKIQGLKANSVIFSKFINPYLECLNIHNAVFGDFRAPGFKKIASQFSDFTYLLNLRTTRVAFYSSAQGSLNDIKRASREDIAADSIFSALESVRKFNLIRKTSENLLRAINSQITLLEQNLFQIEPVQKRCAVEEPLNDQTSIDQNVDSLVDAYKAAYLPMFISEFLLSAYNSERAMKYFSDNKLIFKLIDDELNYLYMKAQILYRARHDVRDVVTQYDKLLRVHYNQNKNAKKNLRSSRCTKSCRERNFYWTDAAYEKRQAMFLNNLIYSVNFAALEGLSIPSQVRALADEANLTLLKLFYEQPEEMESLHKAGKQLYNQPDQKPYWDTIDTLVMYRVTQKLANNELEKLDLKIAKEQLEAAEKYFSTNGSALDREVRRTLQLHLSQIHHLLRQIE